MFVVPFFTMAEFPSYTCFILRRRSPAVAQLVSVKDRKPTAQPTTPLLEISTTWYARVSEVTETEKMLIRSIKTHGGVCIRPTRLQFVSCVDEDMTFRVVELETEHEMPLYLPPKKSGYEIDLTNGIDQSRLNTVSQGSVSQYLAKLAVQAAIAEKQECPISMEAIADAATAYVPPCGHVCGPGAKQLKTCPVCRQVCTWTEVKV